MTIYFLSGLGADERVFQNLTLAAHHQKVFLKWLGPEKKESLIHYAKRMAAHINTQEPFILIGLSFGGILAVEIMEYVQPLKTILISSAACKKELPFYYRWAGMLQLDKLLPERKMSQSNAFLYWCFGVKNKNEQRMLKDILNATDAKFSKWAVHEIINWKRTNPPENIIRIHGTKDRVLPLPKVTSVHCISNGGHFMVLNESDAISKILEGELDRLK
ncbi:MAG TPA: alpha/beta hydrolase [Lacibacter sp.]|nr:alpha/beta hydrolase [Lacibacter sp.]